MINRDRNLRLQYLAGMGLNLYQSGRDLLGHASAHPVSRADVHGVAGSVQAVREAVQRLTGRP